MLTVLHSFQSKEHDNDNVDDDDDGDDDNIDQQKLMQKKTVKWNLGARIVVSRISTIFGET